MDRVTCRFELEAPAFESVCVYSLIDVMLFGSTGALCLRPVRCEGVAL